MSPEEVEQAACEAKAKASAAYAMHPHWEGHWDGLEWGAVRIRRHVRNKMGLAFEPGEISIGKRERFEGQRHYTVYSVKHGVDTWVNCADIEEL